MGVGGLTVLIRGRRPRGDHPSRQRTPNRQSETCLLLGGFGAVVFLAMALAFGAAPFFALMIFFGLAVAAGVVFALKRGVEHTRRRDEELAGEDSRPGTDRELGSAV